MNNKYPDWYSRLIHNVSEEDAEWMFNEWDCGLNSMTKKIADRCGWVSNDREGRFEIYTGYVPGHSIVKQCTNGEGYVQCLIAEDPGRIDYVDYLGFNKNKAEIFMYVVDSLDLKRERDLFLLWQRCISDSPDMKLLRVLMSMAR